MEQGFNKDELERQLQEEEVKLGINPEGSNFEEKKEDPESTKETVENVTEKELNTKLESLEKNVNIVEKNVEEIGGPEVVNQVLNKMSPEDKKVLEYKIEKQKEKIKERQETLMSGFGKGARFEGNKFFYSEGNTSDQLWHIATQGMKDVFSKDLGKSAINGLATPLVYVPLAVLTAPKKAFDTFLRKIKLASEKRKLAKLEKQTV